ncbi:MAG: DUF2357 domain-containing protein [Sphaerochaetaceae bacterium]|nr:DUF2357 domain-containing protein [Spirochaetales bacterium]MDY5500775.1 DUF2357 domain-containing protein [Sphaerochaetaceae bacterium]
MNIAAISYHYQSTTIKLYLDGEFSAVDWDNGNDCELGDDFRAYSYSVSGTHHPWIAVEQGLADVPVLRLTETKTYILRIEGPEDALKHIRLQGEDSGNKFLKCNRDKDLLSFQFINYLGRSRFLDVFTRQTVLGFEVVPAKMHYDDYIALSDALAQHCSQLLLDYEGATSNAFTQSSESAQTLLEQFIFLRQFCYGDNIQSLFGAIKRNPDRLLVKEEEFRPFGGGMPSQKFYRNPFSYGKGWERIGSSAFPQQIAVTHKRDSLDTPANRFVKYALGIFLNICKQLTVSLDKDGAPKQTECYEEAKAIGAMLETIIRDHFFDEVGPLDIMPQNNQVLQKREGYAQIFHAYSMIDLALQLDWRGKDDVYEGESKNVALLYEYWLFFELYQIIRSLPGCEVLKSDENPFTNNDQGHLVISLRQGFESCQSFHIPSLHTRINLYYNRSFQNQEFKATQYEGSYSRVFRPDYTLAIFPDTYKGGRKNGEGDAVQNGAVSYLHFDAKYRVTDLTALIGEKKEDTDALNEEKAEETTNTYKRGDLLKMHTYNDAIRRTIGSFVLYPGTDEKGKQFHLYDEILPGVGAFAIKPSTDQQSEKALAEFIAKVIAEKARQSTRLNRMKYYSDIVLQEPGNRFETTGKDARQLWVIGYLRGDYYRFLEQSGLLQEGKSFLFYYYAIKGSFVYTHHKDIAKATRCRFYTNDIDHTGNYILMPPVCSIASCELVSKAELVHQLNLRGYGTTENQHHADFYYAMNVKVVRASAENLELSKNRVDSMNGNDTFSPHSPKVLSLEQLM